VVPNGRDWSVSHLSDESYAQSCCEGHNMRIAEPGAVRHQIKACKRQYSPNHGSTGKWSCRDHLRFRKLATCRQDEVKKDYCVAAIQVQIPVAFDFLKQVFKVSCRHQDWCSFLSLAWYARLVLAITSVLSVIRPIHYMQAATSQAVTITNDFIRPDYKNQQILFDSS